MSNIVGKKKMQISLSGGRTSAYMAIKLIENFKDEYDFITTFANTGMEHEKTLEFVNNLDIKYQLNVVWLEADVQFNSRRSTRHKIVSFQTASRNSEPFHDVVKKYGIPNKSYPHCTRELKRNVMQSYLRSIGIHYSKIPTAIGIRMDESGRISKERDKYYLVYPLVELFPTDKQDVLDFWENQEFDLGIDEHDGNCKLCFKKSFKKLFKQLDTDKRLVYFHMLMERKYPQVGNKPGHPNRVFFRSNTSSGRLLEMWHSDRASDSPYMRVEDGGCSESCEAW